jgi:hypothetical protein
MSAYPGDFTGDPDDSEEMIQYSIELEKERLKRNLTDKEIENIKSMFSKTE